jgi:cytosine deaminase
MDLLLSGGRLPGLEGLWDIAVDEGRISQVAPKIAGEPAIIVEANGNLVVPTFINGHVHLDKCHLGSIMEPNQSGTFNESLEITWAQKRAYTVEDIVKRASRAVEDGVYNGTTVFRVFADVDSIGGLTPLQGLIALREKWAGIAHIEVVAFPQEAILRDPGSLDLMTEAMRLGADVVGGLPWHEWTDADARTHIDLCFEIAQTFDKDVHMLVDDTDNPNSRSLEYLAAKTLREGFEGRVSASHCGALAAYDEYHAQKVMDLVATAGVSISSNPHISLVAQGRHDRGRVRRGATRVKDLWQRGVNVFSSQDDVDDPYYPFGRNDQQEVAAYVCHASHMTAPDEIAATLSFVTRNAAKALRFEGYGLSVGDRADFNVLAASTWVEALRLQQPPLTVVGGGRVLATTESRRTSDVLSSLRQ